MERGRKTKDKRQKTKETRLQDSRSFAMQFREAEVGDNSKTVLLRVKLRETLWLKNKIENYVYI